MSEKFVCGVCGSEFETAEDRNHHYYWTHSIQRLHGDGEPGDGRTA